MEDALPGIHEQDPHIDDVGVFGKRNGAFSEHLTVPDCVLKQPEDANFTNNPLKCERATQEADFLGF